MVYSITRQRTYEVLTLWYAVAGVPDGTARLKTRSTGWNRAG